MDTATQQDTRKIDKTTPPFWLTMAVIFIALMLRLALIAPVARVVPVSPVLRVLRGELRGNGGEIRTHRPRQPARSRRHGG